MRDEDLARNDMVWLEPGPMDDTYALAASTRTVERTGVRTLSDYAALVMRDPAAARTCVDTEFRARQDGFPGMATAYGFDPARANTPILQVGIIYQATADGTQCDFGEVFTTDGRIAALNLTVLTDDKQFFAHYNPSVTMKRSFFEAHPEIADVTAPVTAAITNEVITELNKQVDVDGRDPSVVARDWMVSRGFVTAS